MTSYMRHSTDIVGYAYQAAIHCPRCIGRKFGPTFGRSTEEVLDAYARKRGMIRDWLDSNDFPAVYFQSEASSNGFQHCDSCRDCIGHDLRDCEAVCTYHSWVAGMMYVRSEDLAAVHAAGRRIECESCEKVYDGQED